MHRDLPSASPARSVPEYAPDYTRAALWMGLVNLLWMLGVVWALWGLPAVLLAGLLLNHAITLLDRHRARRA